MEARKRRFLTFLREFALLARSFDATPEAIREFQHVVEMIDSALLRTFLPNQYSRMITTLINTTKESSGIYYADVYNDDYCHVNAFGFSKLGMRIPIHDHPNQYAAMKVFQGSVKVRSFSIVPDSGDDSSDVDSWSDSDRFVTTKYQGETVLSSQPGQKHCAILGPHNGNIHEVISLEPHTYFCDFFTPICNDCNYYSSPNTDSLTVGQTVHLKRIRCPQDFICRKLSFPRFQNIDHDE